MIMWPVNWQQRVMAATGIPDNADTFAILSAWQQSTPLPASTCNPFGMPAHSLGAKPYLATQYAIFPSFGMFTKAFAAFLKTYTGSQLAKAMQSESPYGDTWRAIHALGWPGAQTETDYPSSLLDLAPESFRDSVKATPPAYRKTSGLITTPNATETSSMSQVASVNKATQASVTARSVVGDIMRGYSGHG